MYCVFWYVCCSFLENHTSYNNLYISLKFINSDCTNSKISLAIKMQYLHVDILHWHVLRGLNWRGQPPTVGQVISYITKSREATLMKKAGEDIINLGYFITLQLVKSTAQQVSGRYIGSLLSHWWRQSKMLFILIIISCSLHKSPLPAADQT